MGRRRVSTLARCPIMGHCHVLSKRHKQSFAELKRLPGRYNPPLWHDTSSNPAASQQENRA